MKNRFMNDYRCPLTDFRIAKVIKASTNELIEESSYDLIFQINS